MEKYKKYLSPFFSILLMTIALFSCIESDPVVYVQRVELSEESFSMEVGGGFLLSAEIYPSNATNKDLAWFSSNETVATIDETGNVVAKSDGTAIITVTTKDGGKTDKCTVTVVKPIVKVESVEMSQHELSIAVGDEYQLTAKINPSDATDKSLIWYSNNNDVAIVGESGLITAISVGMTRVYVKSNDGAKTDYCNITVTPTTVRVESVEISQRELSISVGEEFLLSAEIFPSDATNQDLSWFSNNMYVATVNDDGKVVAIKEGRATITVTTQDGGKTDVCTVIVTKIKDEEPEVIFDLTPTGSEDGYEYVDLGLSVKWATHNIGTRDMEGYGEYYAWGETVPYNAQLTYINYGWSYPPCSPDAVLSSIYDAATELWGDSWRMPTSAEMTELINECTWTWIENINNTNTSGYIATSQRNGKSIFLPASKFMSSTSQDPKENDAIYWTSSTHTVGGKLNFQAGSTAECLKFVNNPGFLAPVEMNIYQMGNGATIRPVIGTPNEYYPDPDEVYVDEYESQKQGFTVCGEVGGYTYVDLGFPSRTLWATYNVGAELPNEYGDYFAWGETSPKASYEVETYKYYAGYSDSKDSRVQLTKYVWNKDYGKPDGIFKLDGEDDAASVNWGSEWCMPSIEQVQELAQLCDFWRKDIIVNGKKVIGYVGESKLNGNRIYIPAAGFEYSSVPNSRLSMWYWTSEISRTTTTGACFFLYRDETGLIECVDGTSRWEGLPVRPVVKK